MAVKKEKETKYPKKKKLIDSDGKKIFKTDYGEWTIYENSNNQYHRIGGPAATWDDGSENWYKDGMLHREDGPALVRPEGDRMFGENIYFIEGLNIPANEFKKRRLKIRLKRWNKQ